VPWLLVAPAQGKVEKGCSLSVSVDWQQAPHGTRQAPITITGPASSRVIVRVVINHPLSPKRDEAQGFVEGNGYVSMEAEHFSRAVGTGSIRWQRILDLGRTLSGMTPFPVTTQSQVPGGNSPRLEYRMHLFSSGMVKVLAYLSPTLDFSEEQGSRYAVSFDDETPQIIPIWADRSNQAWEQSVSDNIKIVVSEHRLDRHGMHVLKFWMVDPGVVLQKLVVDTGGLRPSYLGPPESFYQPIRVG
jgi:hypothetical protein